MARDVSDSTPITSRDQLIAWVEGGAKPPDLFRVGTEHEKIPFYESDFAPVPYEGSRGRGGIRALLEGMQRELGWTPITDGPNIIGLADERGDGGAISLEPGGQFELSGAALADVHAAEAEIATHFAALKRVAGPLGIGFLSLGMSPKWRLDESPVMPKQRYAIMQKYMPRVGGRGLDMMFRTATVQTNLDFSSEADMVLKMRVSLALQPLITALFANSPFTDGKLNGFLSARSAIWLDTDADRTGMLPVVFAPGMGYERYVDYALDVPMYFIKRGETYHDVAGLSFRDLLQGKLAALPGERATLSDWANHLTTIFPEVRLKRFLEMRGADVGPRPFLYALPAFSIGLLYDNAALDGAWQIVKDWSEAQRQALRNEVPRLGLAAKIGGRSLREIGREVLTLVRQGLVARSRKNAGRDESAYLDPLDAVIAAGESQAGALIAHFQGDWGGSVEPAFTQCVY